MRQILSLRSDKNFKRRVTIRFIVVALFLSALEVIAVSVSPVASAVTMAYAVGDTGPGGGKVFYVSETAFTVTGAPCGNNCHYLEWAPTTWATNDNKANEFLATTNTNYYGGGTGTALGTGYNNTVLLATDNAATGYVTTSTEAPRLVRAYRGGGKSDWFIPSIGEWYLISNSTVFSTGGFTGGDNLYWTSTANNDGGPGTKLQLHGVTNLGATGDPGLQPSYRKFPVRPIRAFAAQVPNPIAVTAAAGNVSGSIKVNFSANFGTLRRSVTNGGTASNSAVQTLDTDSQGNLIYAAYGGYKDQKSIKFRTRNSRYDYSSESSLITTTRYFFSLAVDSNNNVFTIGPDGIYKFQRTNGTLGTGTWTETLLVNDSTLCPSNIIDTCTVDFDGANNIITSAVNKLKVFKNSENYATGYLIDGSASENTDIDVNGNYITYLSKTGELVIINPAIPYDWTNPSAKYSRALSLNAGPLGISANGVVIFHTRSSTGALQIYIPDQGSSYIQLQNYDTNVFGCAGVFDVFDDFISGCFTGAPFLVTPKNSSSSQTYTANVYQTDGTTLVKSVANYVSGADITGLTSSTTYKVTVVADGYSEYTNSNASNMLSATTATDPPTITSNTITGDVVAGQILSSNVTSSGSLTRVWKRDGVAITSATGATYSLVAADVGSKITVTATATNSSGSVNSTTGDFGPITALAPAITSVSISGSLIKGQTLTASSRGVTGIPTPESTYVWNRDGTPISGATSSTYVLTTDDIGKAISATITVTNGAGSASATSSGSTSISKITPTLSLSLPAGATTGTYGTAVVITATVSTQGSVSFKSGGSTITGCTFVEATSTTATCTWTPSAANSRTALTADFAPTDSSNIADLTAGDLLTVNVGKATLGITASSHTVAFGGTVPTITPTYSGFISGDTSLVVSGTSCSTTYTTTTSVGTTGSSCTGATASNYSFDYTSGVITVTQGGQTNPLVISSTSVTYGSTLLLVTTGGDGSGANTFVVDSGPCTVSTATLSASAAGTCMVTATKEANGNFLAASSTSTAITVNPKGLTISGLTGVNKEFDGGLSGSVTGTPSLVGVVNSDNVLLSGTPTFAFASANVANGITVTASGYTLTGTTAGNYTLTQPSVTANIIAKAARVAATNTTVAFGAAVTSGFTTSGLISPDVVGSASYTYTGTGTATPPTVVGVYTVTPSNAVFSTGLIGNYSITYDTATVTILAKYTITYNANGGSVSNGSTATIDFVVGDTALTLPTPTRPNYTFTGWYTLQTNGVQVTGAYTPSATATLWARWIQNSLYGMGSNTKILTITTLSGVGNTYSANAGGGTIAIEYLADALPAGTVIDAYVLSDTSTATSLIGAGNDYVMSLVLAWVATDETVPTTATGKPITMTITNSSIKRGAKIYSVIGVTPTLLTTATTDGSAVISITDDPQIIIAITKPDAPTGVSATSGGNASTTVSWTAPSDGGSVITGYTATSNVGQTCSSTTTSCSITGLTNGTPYTFTVTATNSIGTSDPSSASSSITPAAPVVTPPSSGGGGGGSTYVAPTPTVDPAVAAAAAAKALADAKAAEEKAAADAKALAEKRAAEEAELLAQIKALQEKADAESLADAKKLQEELAATQLKAEEELKAAAALKVAEEQRAVAAKKITTVYSTTAAFKLNTTYSKRLTTYSKKIAAGSTVTCIGYAKSSKTLSYAKAKTVATKQAKALCTSMKKINPTLVTKSTVLPASKAPVTTVNKKWIPVSYRVQAPVN